MSGELNALTQALMARDKRIAELEAEKAERRCTEETECEWCNTLIYMRVQRYTLPAMSPLTHAVELEHELINITGKDYVPAEKRYCHVCGRKLRED